MSVRIDDWTLAQALADTLSPDQLHRTWIGMPSCVLPGIRCVRAVLPLENPNSWTWAKTCFRIRRADARSRPC